MARRQIPIKPFVPTTKNLVTEVEDSECTIKKEVWTPPPSIRTLMTKVDEVEVRLAHLESIISKETDLNIKREEQEEMDKSRQELVDLRQQLDDTEQRLQQCEADFQDTQKALVNLSNQTAMDRKKIDLLEAEKKKLHQMVTDLETKLNERVRKVEHLEKQIVEMRRALNHTNNQLAVVQQQVNQIMNHMNHRMNDIASGSTLGASEPARTSQAPQQPVGGTQHQVHMGSPHADNREATSRHHTGTLELPPLPLPSRNDRTTARGSVKFNFPPGKI